jgi:hypothetical protein
MSFIYNQRLYQFNSIQFNLVKSMLLHNDIYIHFINYSDSSTTPIHQFFLQ